jgi:diguanylate cyclase (GGDEF)-like protein
MDVDKEGGMGTPGEGSRFLDQFNLLEKAGALDTLTALRKENRELDALINDAASLFGLSGVEEMIGFVIERLLDRFIPTHLVFHIESPIDGQPRRFYYRNLKREEADFPLEYGKPFLEHFANSPYPITFAELEKRLGRARFGDDIRRSEPELIFPLLGLGGAHGFVLFGKKILGGEYTEVETMYVNRLARFLSIAIQNSLHLESSITDSKTGLYNHYYYMKRLEEELARIGRHHSRAGIIIMDVDHFKIFNDTWGHLAGDVVLSAIARTIKREVRSEDVPARFGGEEFCVLAIECEEEPLFEMAERIRLAIAAMKVEVKTELLSVTVSLGCCLLDPAHGRNPQAFVEKADRALYLSKSMGRNRTTIIRHGLLGRASALQPR